MALFFVLKRKPLDIERKPAYASPMPAKHRTEAEQRYWDEVSIEVARECVRRTMKPAGCTRLAGEVADLMLERRRESIELAHAAATVRRS